MIESNRTLFISLMMVRVMMFAVSVPKGLPQEGFEPSNGLIRSDAPAIRTRAGDAYACCGRDFAHARTVSGALFSTLMCAKS